jgi:hypothetical protein
VVAEASLHSLGASSSSSAAARPPLRPTAATSPSNRR